MAEQLATRHEVTLLSFTSAEATSPDFEIVHVAPGNDAHFNRIEDSVDVIVFQGHAMLVFERMRSSRKVMVVDIYDPMHLEQLEQARELPRDQWKQHVADATSVLNDQLRRGDFFLCASERQRLFWLGQLAGLGRVNPEVYESDPDLTGLIDVAPFGLSRTEPVHSKLVLKGVHPGIGPEDKLLLWSGGLYNWFDPHTLIRAVAEIALSRSDVKLFFQGTKHPHPGVPEMEIVRTSKTLASDLGVLDTHVFFNDSWVDFDDRQNYLLEADLGVSTHRSHIETTFSFRTRILDYLWAKLPMVVTDGDHFGDLVAAEALGEAVPAGDVPALVSAIEKSLFDETFRANAIENIVRVRQRYFWDVTLAPLVDFVDHAHVAADHGYLLTGEPSPYPQAAEAQGLTARQYLGLIRRELKDGGVKSLASKVSRKISRR